MQLWPQKYALAVVCVVAALLASPVTQAEGDAKAANGRIPIARVDFSVTVPHFLDVRVSPSTSATEAASAIFEKVRDEGSESVRGAIAAAATLRVDSVRIASNRGQVMAGLQSDEPGDAGARLRRVSLSSQDFQPRIALRAVAFAVEGSQRLRDTGFLPAPGRAGVTQLRTAWLRAYTASGEAGLIHAIATARPAEASVPAATYTVVVP